VLVTPHRFRPYLRHYAANGIYNVQFMTSRRDERGLTALEWWHDRCLEWCYLRLEEGKFADQKYLDDWPERFEGVHVLRRPGGGLASWNLDGVARRDENGSVTVDGEPLVFFHFHRVRMRGDGGYDWRAPGYLGLGRAFEPVYRPYLATLDAAKGRVWAVEPVFRGGLVSRRGPGSVSTRPVRMSERWWPARRRGWRGFATAACFGPSAAAHAGRAPQTRPAEPREVRLKPEEGRSLDLLERGAEAAPSAARELDGERVLSTGECKRTPKQQLALAERVLVLEVAEVFDLGPARCLPMAKVELGARALAEESGRQLVVDPGRPAYPKIRHPEAAALELVEDVD
jgi:hypothetical protein